MKRKVLLIENDRIVRGNIVKILTPTNYTIEIAKNGVDGIKLVNSFMPDIIICAILMPKLNGLDVIEIITKTPNLEYIPFIFLTNEKTTYAQIRKGMELGVNDYLCKPFGKSELLSAIESRLKNLTLYEPKPPINSFRITNQQQFFSTIKNIDEILLKKKIFNYKKGENIYCKGNLSDHIFLIKKGEVKTFRINEQGKEFITGFFTSQQYFGYSSFIKQLSHLESSKAITNVQLYKINKEEIFRIIKNNPKILYNFIDLLASNIIEAKEQLLLLAYGSVRKKTARTLLHLSEKYTTKPTIEFKITRSDLASFIGIAKETLIRTISDFKEEKIIKENTKGITIIDKNKLLTIQ